MNNRYSVRLSLAILSVAALVSGSTVTTMVYASHHSTSSSNNGSPSSAPSSSGSSGSSGSTSSGSGSGSSGLGSAGSPSSGTSSGVVSGGTSNNRTPSSQEEALLIVIGQAIRPVLVSVPKLVTTPLELAVLQVTARRFVVHITLQQEPPLLSSQGLLTN